MSEHDVKGRAPPAHTSDSTTASLTERVRYARRPSVFNNKRYFDAAVQTEMDSVLDAETRSHEERVKEKADVCDALMRVDVEIENRKEEIAKARLGLFNAFFRESFGEEETTSTSVPSVMNATRSEHGTETWIHDSRSGNGGEMSLKWCPASSFPQTETVAQLPRPMTEEISDGASRDHPRRYAASFAPGGATSRERSVLCIAEAEALAIVGGIPHPLEAAGKDACRSCAVESDASAQVDVFHFETSSWTRLLSFPFGVSFVWGGAAIVAEMLILIGGMENSTPVPTVRSYSFRSERWTTGLSMPIARKGVVSTALNGKLYAVGQLESVRNLADLYDPGGDRWVPLPTLQCPRWRHSLVAMPERHVLFAFGGFDEHGGVVKDVEQYDPRESKWEKVGEMTNPRGFLTGAVHGLDVYALGGDYGRGATAMIDVFDTPKRSWRPCSDMIAVRKDAAATFLQDDLYVIGGYNDAQEPQKMERSIDSGPWETDISHGHIDCRLFHSVVKIPKRLMYNGIV